MEIKPGFYAIIPADVRYHKGLTPNAKLLYGEITALCSKEGFCWASNEYFANLYNKHKDTISGWVGSLVKNKFITVEIVDLINRKIYLVDRQNHLGGQAKTPGGGRQKRLHINTVNNTNKYTPPTGDEPIIFEEELKKLEDSTRRDHNIIALFMEDRRKTLKSNITTKGQLSIFIRRYLKVAGQLKNFTDAQIVKASDAVKVKYKDIDWTLETILKELTK